MCRGTILFVRCDPNSLRDHCIGPLQAPQSHQLQPLQKPKQDRDAERNNRTTCAINQICTAPTANFQPSATPFSLFQTEAPVRDAALTAHLCLISTGFIFKYPFTGTLILFTQLASFHTYTTATPSPSAKSFLSVYVLSRY